MDGMMDNISEMLGSMSEEDMRSLREAAQAMFGASADTDKAQTKSAEPDEAPPFPGIDPAMLLRLSSLMASMNKKDNRSDLIAALKPHLSPDRRKKADEAMQLLKLLDILPLIQSAFGAEKGETG